MLRGAARNRAQDLIRLSWARLVVPDPVGPAVLSGRALVDPDLVGYLLAAAHYRRPGGWRPVLHLLRFPARRPRR